MKQKHSLRRSKGFKALLTFLYMLSVGAAAVGSAVSLYLYQNQYYSSDVEKLTHNLMNDLCADDMYELNRRFQFLKAEGYFDERTSDQLREQLYNGFMDGYSKTDTNFVFTIHDMDDNLLLSSDAEETDYQCARVQICQDTYYESVDLVLSEEEMGNFSFPGEVVNASVNAEIVQMETDVISTDRISDDSEPIQMPYEVYDGGASLQYDEEGAYLVYFDEDGNRIVIRFDEYGTPYPTELPEETEAYAYQYHVYYETPRTENAYYITGYVRSDFTAHDHYSSIHQIVVSRYQYRYVFPVCAAVGAVLAAACLIFLVATAGYGKAQDAPGATTFEKIPFDIFTAVLAGVAVLPMFASRFISDGRYIEMLCIGGIAVIWGLLALWWMMSLAMRLRTKTLLPNNLLYFLGKWIWDACLKIRAAYGQFWVALPFLWQAVLAGVAFVIVHTIATVAMYLNFWLGLLVLIPLYAVTLFYLVLVVWNLHILEKGGQQLAEGNLSDKIPEKRLFGHFRAHAQHLNSVGEGMNKAVSDRLKSEMFRTELISNVSHDIRTPLTSIINYTNLLAALELENPQAEEYISVLHRQSERLRKLTEDVLEASKATTGNVKVNKETMDLRVLLEQMEGEYCERLEEKRLTLVKDLPDEPQYISVDGRLLWRVMENLYGNICKYAMEGTRVYLNLLSVDGDVICMFRNISGAQLNISAEALMERFVQGDRSRNTEGSGLGLSIAQSLTTLQGGKMELQIDGDLFKVTLSFPSVSPSGETA